MSPLDFTERCFLQHLRSAQNMTSFRVPDDGNLTNKNSFDSRVKQPWRKSYRSTTRHC